MAGSAPILFDRALGRLRLARALARGFEPFLVERAAAELAERLALVDRTFPLALDLGTPTDAGAAALQASGRVGEIVRLLPAATAPMAGEFAIIGDEEALPVRPESLDLAVSLLALQGVNDLPGVLAQIRRALKPDGLLLACLLGGDSLNELREAFGRAESEVEDGISPRVAPFADVRGARRPAAAGRLRAARGRCRHGGGALTALRSR